MNKEQILDFISDTFGFELDRITLLESSDKPEEYCMFEVGNISYQVHDWALSIYEQ